MAKETNEEVFAFGMNKDELLNLANSRTDQKDANHPAKSSSYADLIKTAASGREQLKKGGYCKKQG